MTNSTKLQSDLEKWWKHQDKLMSVMESTDDIVIGDLHFKAWGSKNHYKQKTRCTVTYLRTFQSTEPVENLSGETVYPILDVYVDICNGKKGITYKKHRIHCSC